MIQPERPAVNIPAYKQEDVKAHQAEQDKLTPAGPPIQNLKKDQIDQKQTNENKSESLQNKQANTKTVQETVTQEKTTFVDSIKSSAHLSKLVTKPPLNAMTPQLPEPKQTQSDEKISFMSRNPPPNLPVDKKTKQQAKTMEALQKNGAELLFNAKSPPDIKREANKILNQVAKDLANEGKIPADEAKKIVTQAKNQLLNPNINFKNFARYNINNKNFYPLQHAYNKLQNLANQKTIINPSSETIKTVAEQLSKEKTIPSTQAESLIAETSQDMKSQIKSEASLQKGLQFHQMVQKEPANKEELKFLYSNPEFTKATSQEIQVKFTSLDQQASESLEPHFPGLKNEPLNRDLSFVKTPKGKILESKYQNQLDQQNIPPEKQVILKTLFSRPELAEHFPEGKNLLNERNEILKHVAKEINQENLGSEYSEETFNSIMKDASQFTSQFESNLKKLNLTPEMEQEILNQFEGNTKKALSKEGQEAFAKVMEETFSNEVFKKYKDGFSRNTIRETRSLQKKMLETIKESDLPESVKKELIDLLLHPSKERPSQSTEDLFNKMMEEQGLIGIAEAHTKSFASKETSIDGISFICKLKINLKKSGASPIQVDNFIAGLLSNKIKTDHRIVKATLKEVALERGLPPDTTFGTEEIKQALEVLQKEDAILLQNGLSYCEDLKEVMGDLAYDLNDIYGTDSSEPASNEALTLKDFQLSTKNFTQIIATASQLMIMTSQDNITSNVSIQSKVQAALRASTDASLTALKEKQEAEARTMLKKIGNFLKNAFLGLIMFVKAPLRTTMAVAKGGGILNGGIDYALENTRVGQTLTNRIENVLKPAIETIMKVLKVAMNSIKLLIINLPIFRIVLAPGFYASVKEDGFKEAINKSLLDNFTATMEMYGVPPDSPVMVVMELAFIAVQAAIMIAITIAITVLTAGGGTAMMVAIIVATTLAVISQLAGMLKKMLEVLDEAGVIDDNTAATLQKILAVVSIVSVAGSLVVGVGMAASQLPQMVKKVKSGINTTVSIVKEAGKMSEGRPTEFLTNLSAVVKEFRKSSASSAEFFLNKKSARVKGNMDEFVKAIPNPPDNLSPSDAARYAEAVENLKKFNIPETGIPTTKEVGQYKQVNQTIKEIDQASLQVNDAKKSMETIDSLLTSNQQLEHKAKFAKMEAQLDSLDRSLIKTNNQLKKTVAKEQAAAETLESIESTEQVAAKEQPAKKSTDGTEDPSQPTEDPTQPVEEPVADPVVTDPTEVPVVPSKAKPQAVGESLDNANTNTTDINNLNMVENNQQMTDQFLQGIKDKGSSKIAKAAELDEYLSSIAKIAKKSGARRKLERAAQVALLAKAVGSGAKGISDIYTGVVDALKSIPQKKIDEIEAYMDFNTKFTDIGESVNELLEQDSQMQAKNRAESIEFFQNFMDKLQYTFSSFMDASET